MSDPGWNIFNYYYDESQNLFNIIYNNLETIPVYSSNRKGYEIIQMLYSIAGHKQNISKCFNDDGNINRLILEFLIAVREGHFLGINDLMLNYFKKNVNHIKDINKFKYLKNRKNCESIVGIEDPYLFALLKFLHIYKDEDEDFFNEIKNEGYGSLDNLSLSTLNVIENVLQKKQNEFEKINQLKNIFEKISSDFDNKDHLIDDFVKFVDNYLGIEWQEYHELVISKINKIPNDIFITPDFNNIA